MNSDHFTLDELRAFALGHDPEREKLLLEHCRTCSECGDSLAAMLMVTIPAAARQSARTTRNVWLAAVAASVILVGALAIFLPTLVVDEPSVEDQLVALPTVEPLPPAVVRIHLGIMSPAGTDDTVGRLQAAGVALAEGRYEAAIAELERLHDRDPSSRVVAAYLGIALYLTGDDSSRVGEFLATGAEDPNLSIATFTQWYLANFLLRTGQIEDAIAVLETLAPRPTMPGRNGLDLLTKINAVQRQ